MKLYPLAHPPKPNPNTNTHTDTKALVQNINRPDFASTSLAYSCKQRRLDNEHLNEYILLKHFSWQNVLYIRNVDMVHPSLFLYDGDLPLPITNVFTG